MINEMQEFAQEIKYKTKTAGSWINGFWVEGTETITDILAIVQPLKEEELQFAPEGFRADNSLKIKTDGELILQSIVEIDNIEYRIILSKHHRNIFPHFTHHVLKVAK